MTQVHCHLCGGVVRDLNSVEYRPSRATAQFAMPHEGPCKCTRPIVYEDPPIVYEDPPIVDETPPPDFESLSRRELDALVAQHVFGLKVEALTNARTGEKDFVYEVNPSQWVRVAFYTVSMGAAINVELEVQDRGWRRMRPEGREAGEVRVVLQHTDGRTVCAFGSVNEAMCRAALKAVGQ